MSSINEILWFLFSAQEMFDYDAFCMCTFFNMAVHLFGGYQGCCNAYSMLLRCPSPAVTSTLATGCCASSVSRAQVSCLDDVSSFSALGQACKLCLGVWPLSHTLTIAQASFSPIQELWLLVYHMLSSSYPPNSPDCCLCFWIRNRQPVLAEVLSDNKHCFCIQNRFHLKTCWNWKFSMAFSFINVPH